MAELRGFMVSSGRIAGALPIIEIVDGLVVLTSTFETADDPAVGFEYRMVPAEAVFIADRLARAARTLEWAGGINEAAARVAVAQTREYVPRP